MFSSNIGITFGLALYKLSIVSRSKRTSEISLPESQVDAIEENYKYLGILQSLGNNDEEVHCNTSSEYRNRVRRGLRSKLYSKNKVTAINTFAVFVTR